MALAMTEKALRRGKAYSSTKWETFSKPMKAQDEMQAMVMIWFKEDESGKKAGLMGVGAAEVMREKRA